MSKYILPIPNRLAGSALADVIIDIQSILWVGEGGEVDTDKEWNSDTLEQIAEILRGAKLAPQWVTK